jgi:hypothetical protein
LPIISIGGIAFRKNIAKNNQIEYLMICRKHTLGYMDFMRGKYSLFNKEHILNLLKEMSVEEKDNIASKDFSLLWNQLWNKNENEKNDNIQYNTEEFLSFDKITSLKHGIHNITTFFSFFLVYLDFLTFFYVPRFFYYEFYVVYFFTFYFFLVLVFKLLYFVIYNLQFIFNLFSFYFLFYFY